MKRNTLCAPVAALLLTGTAWADMRGQVVCGVPADEAGILALETDSGAWAVRSPAGALLGTYDTAQDAVRAATGAALDPSRENAAEYVCDVEADYNLRTVQGRFYRLGRALAEYQDVPGEVVYAAEFDVRQMIVGELAFSESLTGFAIDRDTPRLVQIPDTPDDSGRTWVSGTNHVNCLAVCEPAIGAIGYGPDLASARAACEAILQRVGRSGECDFSDDRWLSLTAPDRRCNLLYFVAQLLRGQPVVMTANFDYSNSADEGLATMERLLGTDPTVVVCVN